MLAAIAVAHISSVGLQVNAQATFRTPQLSSSDAKPAQLTDSAETFLGESKMAPIQMVGSGDGSVARFQLPQTGPAGGFPQPSSPSTQIGPSVQTPSFSNQAREPELREVGVDGSFLPVQSDFDRDQNEAEAMIDVPGLDLSALGLDLTKSTKS